MSHNTEEASAETLDNLFTSLTVRINGPQTVWRYHYPDLREDLTFVFFEAHCVLSLLYYDITRFINTVLWYVSAYR